jgi:predicted nucleic acid-binding protein
MTRYVIDPDVALALAEQDMARPTRHALLAPTLLRSQVLARLFAEVKGGRLSQKQAHRRLDSLRKLRIRLLGDRVLQQVAWQVAEELDWSDTFQAEYIALTRLQADALVTMDATLAQAASKLVTVASMDVLLATYKETSP